MVEAIDCEQKKVGDITYTSVKFGYDGGKVPPIRINGEFKPFNFKGNYSLSIQCDEEKAEFFEKLANVIAKETCRYIGSKTLKPEELKLVKDSKVGKVVYARIYTRFGKSRCLITNKSEDKSKLNLGDLVGETFKGSCVIKLYQAFVGSNKSITFSVEEILVKEMERRKSFFDEE